MRILVLHSRYLSGPASGENRVAEDEVALLRGAGHDVETWTPEPTVSSKADLIRTGASTVWSPAATREVRNRMRRSRTEIVHVHNVFPTLSPAVLKTAATQGAAVLMTLHNYRLMCLPATFLRDGSVCQDCLGHVPWRGVQRRCYRGSATGSATLATSLTAHRALGTFRHVTRFLAVSGFVRDKYIEAGFPPGQIVVKPNFSDETEPRQGPGDYFLYLGRLAEEKGVDTILDAWRTAPGKLVVVGDGPVGAAVRASAPPGVRFTGQLPATDVPALVRGARALLVPSRWFEAAPRGITEAYAAGVPVLATRIGALQEAVEDGVTGHLVEPEDASAWAAAATTLMDDATSERMGAAALERWRDRFSPAKGLEGLERAYGDALEEVARSR
jgi:glycosyltransferase involved in cell wall biosynthesis